MEIEKLVQELTEANIAYRKGTPIISDSVYDQKIKQLKELDPNHSYLHSVEPEIFANNDKEYLHRAPMLSTDKVYPPEADETSDLRKWADKCRVAYKEVTGNDAIVFRITPKYDGVALRKYQDGPLVTRGDGTKGTVVSHLLNDGLVVIGEFNREWCDGELVVPSDYFEKKMSGVFSHPRNAMAGLCGSLEYGKPQQQMLDDGVVHMVVYKDAPAIDATYDELVNNISNFYSNVKSNCPYLVDGLIIEITDNEVKSYMGSTNHHHKWMVAYKEQSEHAFTEVNEITWQPGRTGIIAPVLEVKEVNLSGANIRRVTAHNLDYLKEHKIGPGSEIEIVRSGEVIPKHVQTITEAECDIPSNCPCCNSILEVDGPFLKCVNEHCDAKVLGQIEHFFKMLPGCDGFGPAIVELFVDNGVLCPSEILSLTSAKEIEAFDITPGIAKNLIVEINKRKQDPIDDWRLLASAGIDSLGRGDSKKLLKEYSFEEIVSGKLKVDDIVKLNGFGEIKANKIVEGIDRLSSLLSYLKDTFTIKASKVEQVSATAITGKVFVLTGKLSKPRPDIAEEIEAAGGIVKSSVNSKTDYLVHGEKVGASKKKLAEKHNVSMMTEEALREMIGE